jgi:hypothetical protein
MNKRKKARTVDTENLTAESRIARAIAVRLIAERVRSPDESLKETRNNVSHRLAYDIKIGKLAPPQPNGFVLGELIEWARKWCPEKSDDLPVLRSGRLVAIGKIQVTGRARLRIGEGDEEIARLEAELQAAYAEIARLRPDAEKQRQRVKNARKKPRKSGETP